MKKLFILALGLVLTGTTAFASSNPDSYSRPADNISRDSYHTISVDNDIDLVLTESDLAGITVVANDKVKKDILVSEKNGVLIIKSKGRSLKNKAIVYVPVTNLKRLVINGSSHVTSSGFLNSAVLHINVNGEASFEIRNNGEVSFETDNDTEIHVDKQFVTPTQAALIHADEAETDLGVATKL